MESNLRRLSLFLRTGDTSQLATLTIDNSWNHLEAITIGGDWCITEPLIHSKPLQSCQQLQFFAVRDDEQQRKPRRKQLSSISLLLR
jgi:hypothetical protein